MPRIPSDYRRIEGSERKPAPSAEKIGPADPKEKFSVTLVLRRRPDGPPPPGLGAFSAIPAGTFRRMPASEFAVKYGASADDIRRVTEFAEVHDLTVTEIRPAARSVVLSGTVAKMSEAFAVDLNVYRSPRPKRGRKPAREETYQTYRGRDGFIYLPAGLADVVLGVFGLDNRSITKRNSNGDPPNTAPITVPQVAQLHNFPKISAAGQTIAIFSEEGYLPGDITQYFAALPGFEAPVLTDVSVDAGNGGYADPETTQDICIAATVAQGAAVAVYFTTFDQKGWVDLIQRVVFPQPGDPVCSVLSSSFYVSNGDDSATLQNEGVSVSWLNAVTAAFQDAAIQGVTVCIASGDNGTDSRVGDGKAHVSYPASDPWVLSCGGTTIGNVSGASFDEWVWNDDTGATGGGVSDFFPIPDYQDFAKVPGSVNDGHSGRGVPDVAANASPNSGYPVIVGGQPFIGNGTSASAPLYAGLIAVVNAGLGVPVGFLNPTLYVLANSVCRDITGPPGPSNNSFNNVPGYPAGGGWNACTGWGVADGSALLDHLMASLFATYFIPS